MKELVRQLTEILRDIHSDSFYQMNPKNPVNYPYLTFEIISEWTMRNQESITLEIDIFGSGKSPVSVIELEEKIKDVLIFRRILTDDLLMLFNFQTGLTIPTLVDNLHRRNLTFNILIELRNKVYGKHIINESKGV